MEYIFWIFFFLFAFGVPFGISRWIRRNRLPDEPIEGIEGLADTDLVCVPFKGEWVTLTKIDYLQRWMFMNRFQRSKIWDVQMKALKQGKVKKHYFGEAYQILPTDKGKQYENIHRLKDEIYREEK
jgi:hypothetical protein